VAWLLDMLAIGQALALAVGLSCVTYWVYQSPTSMARNHLLRLFLTAALWSWFVAVRNVLDIRYDSLAWNVANLVLAGLALWSTWRCVRWVLR
jgi:hypothetical protein